jgi:DDE superfamily endonuclease
MWPMLASLRSIVDVLAPAFTGPSRAICNLYFLCSIMCLRKKTIARVGENAHPESPPDHSQRHQLDSFYNFFERSAWTPAGLAKRIGLLILTHLKFTGCVTLLVDDTLLHKTGKCVWGLGWFRDAVASTRKRVATASGHNWVVMAIAFCNPVTGSPILALPLLAHLHQSGKGSPSCSTLARAMLALVLEWYPNQRFTLVGDGAYATKIMLTDLPEQVTFVGRMRGDAAVYDPRVPSAPKSKRGRKATKGAKFPSPKDAAKKADRKRTGVGAWLWQTIVVWVYGNARALKTVSYEAVWSHVLGVRRIQIVVVRDPLGVMDDIYLFTTDLKAGVDWVITQFAWRWSIEVLFRASKQTLDIEAPQHWCQSSVEKVAPWVWSMQSVIMVWYLTAGRDLPEAIEMRSRMGEWDSEWSLRHMVQVMRSVILNTTFNTNSADSSELEEMVNTLKSWGNMAA